METFSEPKRKLRADLLSEIYSAGSGTDAGGTTITLSENLREKLERLDKTARKEIVSVVGIGKQEYLSPFLIACRQGNLEIVEYLIETCRPDLEQEGNCESYDLCSTGTPLCCAAERGRFNIVNCLVEYGANVNAVSENGSTPVLRACVNDYHEVVRYLVEHAGADINLPNFKGVTCLMKSVQSSTLCEYLLSHGADVNEQDNQLRIALHYAIQLRYFGFETVQVLLAHGADPFLKNLQGDDAFQTCCLEGGWTIFPYFVSAFSDKISMERQAELYELMGSVILNRFNGDETTLNYWGKAIEIRLRHGLPKKSLAYTPPYARISIDQEVISEFNTKQELGNISTDSNLMYINSLLITERILGLWHEETISMITSRARDYDRSSQYRKSIILLQYALQLRIQIDSCLTFGTCRSVSYLIRLYHRLDSNPDYLLKVSDLLHTFQQLVEQLPACAELVKVRPVSREQQLLFDGCLWYCTHLLHLLLRAPNMTQEESLQFRKITEKIVGCKQWMLGDSLLHVALRPRNILMLRSSFFRCEGTLPTVGVFPSVEVTKYLIECGANVNAMNAVHATPLHLAVSCETPNSTIIRLLLENGAHLDSLNRRNHSPLSLLQSKNQLDVLSLLPLEHISLKCMAAGAVGRYGVSCDNLPEQLWEFIEIHRPTYENDGK